MKRMDNYKLHKDYLEIQIGKNSYRLKGKYYNQEENDFNSEFVDMCIGLDKFIKHHIPSIYIHYSRDERESSIEGCFNIYRNSNDFLERTDYNIPNYILYKISYLILVDYLNYSEEYFEHNWKRAIWDNTKYKEHNECLFFDGIDNSHQKKDCKRYLVSSIEFIKNE